MASLLLEVSNLKTYFFTRRGIVKAVDDVSFILREGETLGLVGESGCGKSNTALSLLRLIPEPPGRIVGGQIFFEGEDLLLKSDKEMRKVRGKKISIIFQDPMTSLNPAFTIGKQVTETISLHQGIRGNALWNKAKEVLQLVRIPSPEARLHNYPHQLSGGMNQRVVGAIALSCQPRLLIADEPTTALDVTVQDQYLSMLKEIQQQAKMGILFITHDLGVVGQVCDRVAVMYAGKIVETARVEELFKRPLHPYTSALMGAVPKLEGKLEKLVSIDGQPPVLHQVPPGCTFSPRCKHRNEKCTVEFPPLVNGGNDHWVNCWLYT